MEGVLGVHTRMLDTDAYSEIMRTNRGVKFADLRDKIRVELKRAISRLSGLGYKAEQVSPREFFAYMMLETPSGDTITISDVLGNEFLMIHEVVEMSELKKRGIVINQQTVMSTPMTIVYETHYAASELEFQYALRKGNHDWLRIRMDHVRSWLDDHDMPPHLIQRYNVLIEKTETAREHLLNTTQ